MPIFGMVNDVCNMLECFYVSFIGKLRPYSNLTTILFVISAIIIQRDNLELEKPVLTRIIVSSNQCTTHEQLHHKLFPLRKMTADNEQRIKNIL